MSGITQTTFDEEETVEQPEAALPPDDPSDDNAAGDPDDLQIEEPSLLVAIQRQWRDSVPRSRGFLTALTLAVVFHVVLVAGCIFLAARLHVFAPRLELTQGSSGSHNELVAEAADQSSQDDSVPGPVMALPQPARTSAPPANPQDAGLPPDLQSDTSRQTQLDLQHDDSDPLAFGVHADPIGPMPKWRRSAPQVQNGNLVAASTPSVQASALGHSPPPSAPVHHSYVAPRGAGRGGGADQGVGYDDRGIPIPEYPPESFRRHEEGAVELQVLVRADGSVGGATIVRSSSFPRLDRAALAAVQVAHFTPGTCDGAPVAMQVVVPFRFIIQ